LPNFINFVIIEVQTAVKLNFVLLWVLELFK